MLYVSPGQVNFQIPFETATGTISVSLSRSGVKSNTATPVVFPNAPALFSQNEAGTGLVAARHVSGAAINKYVTTEFPVEPGATIRLYATGLGNVTPNIQSGTVSPAQIDTVLRPLVTISNKVANVQSAKLIAGSVGVYEILVDVPANLATGIHSLLVCQNNANVCSKDTALAVKNTTGGGEVPTGQGTDTDGDGISDVFEQLLGTDPKSSDTDHDGISDGQEFNIDGTDPLDHGSAAIQLGSNVCTEFNSFLGPVWNVFEHVNLSSQQLSVQNTVFNIAGVVQDTKAFTIRPGSQVDVLVHDLRGFGKDTYGIVCAAHNGGPGALDGSIVYYRPTVAGAKKAGDFQFAFSLPIANGKAGRQYLSFNTFQPSNRASDQGNLAANWIQITNRSLTKTGGQLFFYGQDGQTIGSDSVTLNGGERRDISGHRFGRSKVGLVEWVPNDSTTTFLVRNIRYMYDNPNLANSFATAYPVEGVVGSGRLLSVPLDTTESSAIVEVLNTSNAQVNVTVKIYSASGIEKQSIPLTLGAHASRHIIADQILGARQLGLATVIGDKREAVAAYGLEYRRAADGALLYAYALPAREALGSVLRGSYNTFLRQLSTLVLMNPTNTTQTASIGLVRSESVASQGRPGTLLLDEVSLPPHGVKTVSVNDFDTSDSYGVVTVQPQIKNTILGWVLRQKEGEFVVSSPVR